MGLFSKFKKNKKDSSMDDSLNSFFRLKDTKYSPTPIPDLSQFEANNKDAVIEYLRLKTSSNTMTTRDFFAQDALDNQAYTQLAQALQRELGQGDIRPSGSSDFEWNPVINYVITSITVRDYYGKTVIITLGVNCKSLTTGNAITITVGEESAKIPLDPIPDAQSDASFIYDNTATKVKDYLVSKGFNS